MEDREISNTTTTKKVLTGISLMPQPLFREAIFPLLESNQIEAIDWSMDIGWGMNSLPEWMDELHSKQGTLYGHGVMLSPGSSKFFPQQRLWLSMFRVLYSTFLHLTSLKQECKKYNFRHVTEHFGFMLADGIEQGFPAPLPFTEGSLKVMVQRLRMMSKICHTRVGLENLALAMSTKDVQDQAAFFHKILDEIDGVMLLDIHNLYCQIHNWDLNPTEALKRYPLHRVREIHISGGSWSYPKSDELKRAFRRDTHDGDVPKEVLDLLPIALELCENVEVVVLERLGESLTSQQQVEDFRKEYLSIKRIVDEFNRKKVANLSSIKNQPSVEFKSEEKMEEIPLDKLLEGVYEDDELAKYQSIFLQIVGQRVSPQHMLEQLKSHPQLKPFDTYIHSFEPRCVEICAALAKRWIRYKIQL